MGLCFWNCFGGWSPISTMGSYQDLFRLAALRWKTRILPNSEQELVTVSEKSGILHCLSICAALRRTETGNKERNVEQELPKGCWKFWGWQLTQLSFSHLSCVKYRAWAGKGSSAQSCAGDLGLLGLKNRTELPGSDTGTASLFCTKAQTFAASWILVSAWSCLMESGLVESTLGSRPAQYKKALKLLFL